MVRASFAAIALFALVGQCVADTVLGGMVDYLPKCFQDGQGDFLMFIEYNNVLTDGVRDPIYILEHKTLEGLYGAAADDMVASRYVPPVKAEKYITNTVTQPFDIRNKADIKYLGISLKAGIRMIRIRYIPNIFQPEWMRGVQVRFTQNMVSKIQVVENGVPDKVAYSDDFGFRSNAQTLGIDLECFMAVGSIQQENRVEDYQLESCFYLVAANYTRYFGAYVNEGKVFAEDWMVRNPVELAACEQKAKVIAPPPPEEDPLFSALKFIVTSAVGFIPVFGPVLAFGVGAAFELAESQEKFNQYVIEGAGNAAVSKAQSDWPKLKKVLSKIRKR